ncbi:hypothetical protein [Agilicoccus flavus]|uniref:hypothetical protein n=1 Tax=Agilicoccus flavus TaxID=2775968 RepID=UPI001CF6D0A9|nr:hypothetical protein [Agilicoccus flavus]
MSAAGALVAAAVLGAGAASPAASSAASVGPSRAAAPGVSSGTTGAADRMSAAFTAPSGTRSTYHLFTSRLTAPAKGLVVYLDGDGMYGHDHPSSTWALGGSRGVVAQAAARGLATLSVRTPDRSGTPTFWENGTVNAAYVAALTRKVAGDLRTDTVWVVGYSGGSQLITKYLLPAHADLFTRGGAVITGGGGAPRSSTAALTRAASSRMPLLWYTGSDDDGSTADDGYDALADAKRGAAWYQARGFAVTRQQPAGIDHDDLGGRFGTVFAGAFDAARPAASARGAVSASGWATRVVPSRTGVRVSVSFPRGTKGRVRVTVRDAAGRARSASATTVTRSVTASIAPLSGRHTYVVDHAGVVRATGAFTTAR